MNGEELAKLLAEGRGPAITQPTQRLSLALKETASFVPAEDADRHPVLLCGSLYLLGEFFNLHPQTLEQELVRDSSEEAAAAAFLQKNAMRKMEKKA